MKQIRVLDVTLRDGGCVNDFNFGQPYMERILEAQEKSGVDIIELGYLDENKGSLSGRTQYKNEQIISDCILKDKKEGTVYVAMMDYGKFDPHKLLPRAENGIDGIRLAFHKKNRLDMVALGRIIMEKGYRFYIQPMITLRYSDTELLELIDLANRELPQASGFYIVDSFGEMRSNDMMRILNLVDHNLIETMPIGYHSHNNLQMSYSNAVSLLQFPTNRDLMLDSSIMGMGKGAGNLNTELLLEHLNLYYGKHYDTAPLLEVMDKVLNQIKSEFYWGYAPEYYLSSVNHCTPSYASHFYNKHMIPIDQVGELLGMIDEDKKISFDREYAENLYHDYNANKAVDDEQDVKELLGILAGRTVLLIAPGKSISVYRSIIQEKAGEENVVSISLNLADDFGQKYIIFTRKDSFDEAVSTDAGLILMSNVSKGTRGNAKILNYENWTERDDGAVHDSSSVVAFNLAERAGVKKIILAGFDGFSAGINDNYYNSGMRVPVTDFQAHERNKYYKERIGKLVKMGMEICFLTPSKYQWGGESGTHISHNRIKFGAAA